MAKHLTATDQVKTNTFPDWAIDQLELRQLIKQGIIEIQKWQDTDGAIFSNLSQFKWDDEVEIFYNWCIYYQLTGDESVYRSIKGAAMTYLNRVEYLFEHGYFKEPYFDTEHTLEGLIILANLVYLKPTDGEIVAALEDIVEHAGNWVPDYASWYNPATRHLKSVHPGTKIVDSGCPSGIDWVFNLQFAKMALAAYYANQNDRYLQWVGDYLTGWIQTIEKNESENGFYVIPSEVDPATGQIGPCSGVWYYSEFEPGWGWNVNGNNTNRDLRGPFMDYFRLTGDKKYFDCIKKQVITLFMNGSDSEPAHYFDGSRWLPDTDKVTAYMSIESSLMDPEPGAGLDEFLLQWYDSNPYHFPEMHFWYYRKYGDIAKINGIHHHAIRSAMSSLEKLKALTTLPAQPDDFPKLSGSWGLSLVPFGGITALRGEMPWTEVRYFKNDNSPGLDEGVAALLVKGDTSIKEFWLCNTNSEDRQVKVQANFNAAYLNIVMVNNKPITDYDSRFARILVPAEQTVHVQLQVGIIDTIPPNAPQNLRQTWATENTLGLAWEAPVLAVDGDAAKAYRIYRDGTNPVTQDSLTFLDINLQEQETYHYEVYSIDKAGNQSLSGAQADFTTVMDRNPPDLVSVIVTSETKIQLTFSESLERNNAENIQNYIISPTLKVFQAQLLPVQNIVQLTTAPHSDGSQYSIKIVNLTDNSRSRNSIDSITIAYEFIKELKIENISRGNYFVKTPIVGDPVYSDRNYRLSFLPESLQHIPWIITANEDKTLTGEEFLSFSVNKNVSVVIAYDHRCISIPPWLQSWHQTEFRIETDDTYFLCFSRDFLPGNITLGANMGHNSTSMYLILVKHKIDRTAPAAPTGIRTIVVGGG